MACFPSLSFLGLFFFFNLDYFFLPPLLVKYELGFRLTREGAAMAQWLDATSKEVQNPGLSEVRAPGPSEKPAVQTQKQRDLGKE